MRQVILVILALSTPARSLTMIALLPGVHIGPQSAIAGNVKIEEGSFLGVGCKVIPEIRIGSHSVIGAGAVVIENIPNNSVAVGVPAKIRESR